MRADPSGPPRNSKSFERRQQCPRRDYRRGPRVDRENHGRPLRCKTSSGSADRWGRARRRRAPRSCPGRSESGRRCPVDAANSPIGVGRIAAGCKYGCVRPPSCLLETTDRSTFRGASAGERLREPGDHDGGVLGVPKDDMSGRRRPPARSPEPGRRLQARRAGRCDRQPGDSRTPFPAQTPRRRSGATRSQHSSSRRMTGIHAILCTSSHAHRVSRLQTPGIVSHSSKMRIRSLPPDWCPDRRPPRAASSEPATTRRPPTAPSVLPAPGSALVYSAVGASDVLGYRLDDAVLPLRRLQRNRLRVGRREAAPRAGLHRHGRAISGFQRP